MQTVTTGGLLNKQELIKEVIRPTKRSKRFFNYLIDMIFFYIIMFTVGIILGGMAIISGDSSMVEESTSNNLLWNLIGILILLTYYITFESFLGKTIGKMVTNTKVVTIDGSKPTVQQIIKRSFIRMIPFEFLSLLSDIPQGWHDKWSNTMVVDDISLYHIPNTSSAQAKVQEEI